ncbi:MAG TPA: hypothetical protein VJ997_10575 [Longimicrobiales bacterium]|nr:hypothetical protein [Longimicrobiales bacterium]
MRRSFRHAVLTGALAALILVPGCAPASDEGTPPAGAATDDCPALDWFPHATTREPDSGGFQGDSQCAFHQWSWQAFLWLTQDDGTGRPRFMSFTRPGDLLGGAATKALFPRMAKSKTPEPLDEFLQAGTDGIMTDQAGRPIYYSLYVDPVYERFVTSNNLTDPAALLAFDPARTFPDSALSLKASWRVVDEGEDVSGYFTMETDVYALANRRGAIVIDTTRTASVTLALVGFHIAGRVKDHPEMIWATFEHVDNAPSVFTHENIGDAPGLTDPVSDRDWTFYAAGTPRSQCNVNMASSPARHLDEASQTISPITQVCREYRYGNLPTGDTTSAIERLAAANDANVASLNGHVLDSLATDDVWRNYPEVGAIWFTGNDALVPGVSLDGLCVTGTLQGDECVDASGQQTARLIGSLRLSNSTIETFTQSQSTMYNCFRCHNTQQRFHTAAAPRPGQPPTALPAKNVNISHILVNGFFRNQDE